MQVDYAVRYNQRTLQRGAQLMEFGLRPPVEAGFAGRDGAASLEFETQNQ